MTRAHPRSYSSYSEDAARGVTLAPAEQDGAERATAGMLEAKAFSASSEQGGFATNAVSGGGTPPGSAARMDYGASDLNRLFFRPCHRPFAFYVASQ